MKLQTRLYTLALIILWLLTQDSAAVSLHVTHDTYADSAAQELVAQNQQEQRKNIIIANLSNDTDGITAGEKIAYFSHDLKIMPDSLEPDSIDKAILRVWVHKVINEGVLLLHLVTQDWDEDTLNYNNRPTISPAASAINITQQHEEGWLTIDITPLFKSWIVLPDLNFGIALSSALVPNAEGAVVILGAKESIYAEPLSVEPSNIYGHHTSTRHGPGWDHDFPGCPPWPGPGCPTCPPQPGPGCPAEQICEDKRKNACHKAGYYFEKAEYFYQKAEQAKVRCQYDPHYCELYHKYLGFYQRFKEKAEKQQTICLDKDACKCLCGNCDGDGGNGDGNFAFSGNRGLPSEIEVTPFVKDFDLVSQHAVEFASVEADEALKTYSSVTTQIQTAVNSHLMYISTLSFEWGRLGRHTIQCEAIIYRDEGPAIQAPLIRQQVSADVQSETIAINGSSLGQIVKGDATVEIYCDIVDTDGNPVAHNANGTITTWSVPAT